MTSSIHSPSYRDSRAAEHARYFPVSGEYLYTVLHEVDRPLARVLLVGPFASERQNSYLPWVRWARYLAARNIEVLRFDYRGIGESTGVFDEMTFDKWSEDILALSGWLKGRSPDVPLVMHGLEIGGLLAGRAFHDGIGDALLLWSPPSDANQALRSTLVRWIGLQQMFKCVDERRSVSEYIKELEQGAFLEVEGYQWSPRLWRDSTTVTLPSALANETTAFATYQRPVRTIKLTKDAAPFAYRGSPGHDEVKDFTRLFAPNLDWIALAASTTSKGVTHA